MTEDVDRTQHIHYAKEGITHGAQPMHRRVFLGTADPLLTECIARLLAEHHQILLPQHSDRLLREAEQLHPQLMILDDSLEDDITSLCRTLKRRLPECRLLYLSTNWQPSLAAQLQAHGIDTVLHKPFASDKLIESVNQLLDATPC